jgi:DNA-binding winged helix-turn-helix (wHTH) protein
VSRPPSSEARLRYRFGPFVLSPQRRVLLREGIEVPLIPRYLDLLLLLVRRRNEAVTRRDIMDAVWSDVIVSDGALSQAVRSLRRALGDDSREPIFIRTVSRHGYRFVVADVAEESEDAPSPVVGETATATERPPAAAEPAPDPFAGPLAVLLVDGAQASGVVGEAERREAAETLHLLGTEEALRRLSSCAHQAAARALLRDARWDVPGAGEVPLLGAPQGLSAAAILVRLRLARALRAVGSRFSAASAGGALAGLLGGVLGGLALTMAPGSTEPASVLLVLGVIGAAIGGAGAFGVGAGLALAEALARSLRGPALLVCGALGGAAIGAFSHEIGRSLLEGLFGHVLGPTGGGLEGLVLGGAAGLGYALATPRPEGGMATPHGRARVAAVLTTGLCCAAAALVLTALGRNLCGASLNTLARAFEGSHVGLTPVARLLGEPEMGPLTRAVIGGGEGLLFGCGLALGLTHRPRVGVRGSVVE